MIEWFRDALLAPWRLVAAFQLACDHETVDVTEEVVPADQLRRSAGFDHPYGVRVERTAQGYWRETGYVVLRCVHCGTEWNWPAPIAPSRWRKETE